MIDNCEPRHWLSLDQVVFYWLQPALQDFQYNIMAVDITGYSHTLAIDVDLYDKKVWWSEFPMAVYELRQARLKEIERSGSCR